MRRCSAGALGGFLFAEALATGASFAGVVCAWMSAGDESRAKIVKQVRALRDIFWPPRFRAHVGQGMYVQLALVTPGGAKSSKSYGRRREPGDQSRRVPR